MKNNIDLQVDIDLHKDLIKKLLDDAQQVYSILNIRPGSISILLADDTHIQQLNRQFRNIDKPTDVLSFPGGDPLPGLPESNHYLGDIIISAPTTFRQAVESGHSFEAEFQLLLIHGILHLLGFDHASMAEKKEMWAKQEEILGILGYENIAPTEY